MNEMPTGNYDVVIIGGGVIGCSIAYFLTKNPSVSVAVVEVDPTYEWNATPRSAGGIRTQFSTAPNVKMSIFAAEFFRDAAQLLEVEGARPEIGFKENGYLLLADADGAEQLHKNQELQMSCGASVNLMSPKDMSAKFPWLNVGDLASGALGVANEGWLDPYGLLQAFRKKARSQGAVFCKDLVVALQKEGSKITGVELDCGAVLGAGTVVNAAGVHGADIARLAADDELPVVQKKRQIFAFSCREELKGMPLIVDPSGVYFRPENDMYICGLCPPEDQDPITDSYDVDYSQFEQEIWPVLAARVPAFEAIKMNNAWAGHYDINVKDHNAVLGRHPNVENFIFANGFSGHGLQQSPSVGRGISELILNGSYQTLDLSDYAYERFAHGDLIVEKNVF